MPDAQNEPSNYLCTMSAPDTKMIAAVHRAQEWLQERQRVFDVAFAGLAALLSLGELSGESINGLREPDLLGVVLILVGAFALIWRRSVPIVVVLLVAGVSSVFYTLNYGSFMAFVGTAALYSVAAHEPNRRMAWIVIGTVATGLVVLAGFTVLDGPDGFSIFDASGMVISISAVVLAGAVIRNKNEIFADTKERAERAEADRKAAAERAVANERLRIAREMHDVVAHGMSLITVQAAAAREIVDTRPDDAARLMHSVETTGRNSLADMRRMLGVLRNDEPSETNGHRSEMTPQPSLDDLGTIIAHCNEAGTPTGLDVSGDRRQLAPGLELAAFRTVQEALTNAVKHGGEAATASVALHYDDAELHITVTDTGRGAAAGLSQATGGHGLIGMRERIELYDGRLMTGPRPGGGYEVRASLPLSPAKTRPAVVAADATTTA